MAKTRIIADRAVDHRRGLSRMPFGFVLGTAILVGLFCVAPPAAHADLVRGLMRVVGGVLEIPRSTLAGTFSGPPIIGTLVGALSGAVNGVMMVATGAIETVVSAIPLAEKLAPLIPVFF